MYVNFWATYIYSPIFSNPLKFTTLPLRSKPSTLTFKYDSGSIFSFRLLSNTIHLFDPTNLAFPNRKQAKYAAYN